MSGLYNAIFGENDIAGLALALLGFKSRADVGRFRDAGISDGMIYVYTRNGGGNRDCGCRDSSDESPWGTSTCKGHSFEREEDEYTQSGLIKKTGNRITVRRYVCEAPNSEDCGCYGCIITYRLPKHPLYVRDEDDDFDCTYATVYFRFPPEVESDLKAIDSGEKWEPSKRWTDFLDAMKNAPAVASA